MDNSFWDNDSFSAPDPWQSEPENSDPFNLFEESNDFSFHETPEEVSLSDEGFSLFTPSLSRQLANVISDFTESHFPGDVPSEMQNDDDLNDLELENTSGSNDFIPVIDAETPEMTPSTGVHSDVETPVAGEETQGNFFDDIFHYFWSFFGTVPNDSYVPKHSFTDGGNFDSVNHLIVVGDVEQDVNYVDRQTAGSCSLMAQEQFVHRYLGESVPENLLEAMGERDQVYDPEIGTIPEGQTRILEHFGVPFERDNHSTMKKLEYELDHDHDCIVGVDARVFYNDPTIPPHSGHAVAVVGKGVDPITGETRGFYVTDSNYPNGAHFLTLDDFQDCWHKDMISIPNNIEA